MGCRVFVIVSVGASVEVYEGSGVGVSVGVFVKVSVKSRIYFLLFQNLIILFNDPIKTFYIYLIVIL